MRVDNYGQVAGTYNVSKARKAEQTVKTNKRRKRKYGIQKLNLIGKIGKNEQYKPKT